MTPTVEWQVAGACNYACSYCIQSPRHRRGRPVAEQIEGALAFFASLPGAWEIKMSGGEAFAHPLFLDRIVPGLLAGTPHRVSVLTNLSASHAELERFCAMTAGRLAVFSASLHLEHVTVEDFAAKARFTADRTAARFVVNQVVFPDRLEEAARCRAVIEAHGLRWFPQLYKVGGRVVAYPDEAALRALIGDAPGPREANVAPSYRGRVCHAGAAYFVVGKDGEAWACRTGKRHGAGRLGNVFDGTARLRSGPMTCPWDVCPCTVPANRGMIEGVAT